MFKPRVLSLAGPIALFGSTNVERYNIGGQGNIASKVTLQTSRMRSFCLATVLYTARSVRVSVLNPIIYM